MKIFVYSYREDEEEFFEQFSKHHGFDLSFTRDNLNENSVYLSKGYEAVNIAAVGKISASIIRALKDNGVKYIVSRAAGVNHLDSEAIRKNGLKAANVPSYSPNAISEHTLTLAL
ncbi:MAG: D-lactate dehydrogenase, partial [Clostridia bacterium]|nr:D-lactate dehydrogenase [Clostridia bacterium]